MSRLLGAPFHTAYVYPDFDAALERFAAGGIGPFFVMHDTAAVSIYRGEEQPLGMSIAFVYSGDACMEIITPTGQADQQSAYDDFLAFNPHGGLHHIAYYSDDFDATLAAMAAAGRPLRVVQEFAQTADDPPFEIYCEPVGVENPLLFQFLRPGLFDAWFDAMRDAAAGWDGSDPIRDASALLAGALAEGAG
jgi:catechol 2,3-dioxygenase-like lactoylglutathione lyase family enzyme